jgi:ABC-type sugar transport system permease subunit
VATRTDAPAPKARLRHAHLYITHLDPWSVMKNAFMLALAIAVVAIVAVTILWSLLALSGTLDAVTRTLTDIAGGGANTLDMANLFSFSRVIGVTAVLSLLEVILVTALATLFAFLYNISVGITGGLQVTLTDDA